MPRSKPRNKPPESRPLTDELLAAVRESGQSLYGLAQASGVDPSTLSRFTSRERDLSLANADRLARSLGLRLVRPPRSHRRKAQEPG